MINRVYARTHAEFLNTVFGTAHKGYYQTVWPYHGDSDFVVWMVRFYNENDWRNRLLENGDIAHEEYIGKESKPTWKGKPITLSNIAGKRRIVVSVEERCGTRSYTVLGGYDLSYPESTGLNRIWRRLPDERAKMLAPEIYKKTL